MLRTIAIAALVLASTSASAAVFDLTYYSRLDLEPTIGHLGNRADMPVVATGRIDIDESAIAPNAFVPFESPAVNGFSTTYDHDGLRYEWVLGHDLYTAAGAPEDRQLGLLFDDEGRPFRFDRPVTVVSNQAKFEDVDAVARRPYPALTIWDDNNFDLVFAEEAVDRLGRRGPVSAGELVSLAVLPAGAAYTRLANRWSLDNTPTPGGDQGYLLTTEATGAKPGVKSPCRLSRSPRPRFCCWAVLAGSPSSGVTPETRRARSAGAHSSNAPFFELRRSLRSRGACRGIS